jgi:voltage-gated potassium channel
MSGGIPINTQRPFDTGGSGLEKQTHKERHLATTARAVVIHRIRDDPHLRRIAVGVLVFATLLAFGTAGYMLIEGWPFLDALFMTAITLSTVGYGQVHTLSSGGMIFSIFLIFFGVGAVLYVINAIIQTVFEGHLQEVLGVRKMRTRIDALRGHYVICGFGRVGQEVAHEFEAQNVPFVVIENDLDNQDHARSLGYLYVTENATAEEALLAAGVRRARGLIAAVGSDAENTYITLCARSLNPRLLIVARAGSNRGEERLRQAGADKVISPYRIGGRSIAFAAVYPQETEFVESVHGDRWVAEIRVDEVSNLAGLSIEEALSERPGVNVVLAVQARDGELMVGPPPERRLEMGDCLIVLGKESKTTALKPNPHELSEEGVIRLERRRAERRRAS